MRNYARVLKLALIGCIIASTWPVLAGGQLSLDDLQKLHDAGVAEEVMVALVAKECVSFDLDADALLRLNAMHKQDLVNAVFDCKEVEKEQREAADVRSKEELVGQATRDAQMSPGVPGNEDEKLQQMGLTKVRVEVSAEVNHQKVHIPIVAVGFKPLDKSEQVKLLATRGHYALEIQAQSPFNKALFGETPYFWQPRSMGGPWTTEDTVILRTDIRYDVYVEAFCAIFNAGSWRNASVGGTKFKQTQIYSGKSFGDQRNSVIVSAFVARPKVYLSGLQKPRMSVSASFR